MAETQISSQNILDGSVVNADISSSADIDFSKLAVMAPANVLVGSAGSVATPVPISGDLSITAAGASTVVELRGTPLSATPPSSGQVLTFGAGSWEPAAPASSGHLIEDHGSPVTVRTKLDFNGAGVSLTDNGFDTTIVTVASGAGSFSQAEFNKILTSSATGSIIVGNDGNIVYRV